MAPLSVSEGATQSRHTADITFPLLWRTMLRRKKIILLWAVLGAGAAFLGSRMLPLQYSAEGTLHALPSQTPGGPPLPGNNKVGSEADVLLASGLLHQVVLSYHFDSDLLRPKARLPEFLEAFWQIAQTKLHDLLANDVSPRSPVEETTLYLAKHIQIDSKEGSNVLTLRFSAAQPQLAADVVNGIMDTYVKVIQSSHRDELQALVVATQLQMTENQTEISSLEQKVAAFVQAHNLTEAQNSSAPALMLVKYQDQLALAHDDLAHKQAALETLNRNDLSGTEEVLDSKTIQRLKETRANLIEQVSKLSPTDSRRLNLQNGLTGINNQIETETRLVATALARDVAVAKSKVQILTAMVSQASHAAMTTSGEGSELKMMLAGLEAKRALNTHFAEQAGQMRLAGEQAQQARVMFPAMPPQMPARTYGALSLTLGFCAGFIGAGGFVVGRAVTRQRIYSSQDIAMATGRHVVGCLPDLLKTSPRLTAIVEETLRAIWLSLRPLNQSTRGVVVLVTSSEAGEGKTSVAAAMAERMVLDNSRVLLIDTDMRRPRVSSLVKIRGAAFLENVLRGEANFTDAVVTHRGIHCLLAEGDANPTGLLLSKEFGALIESCRSAYDFILLDSPPVLRVADALLMAASCQYVLFVAQADRLPGHVIDEAMRRFPEAERSKILSLVTRVPIKSLSHQDYYGGYPSLGPS